MSGPPDSLPAPAVPSRLLSALRVKLLFLWTASMYALFLLRSWLIRDPSQRRAIVPGWLRFWAGPVCRIAGWKVSCKGPPPPPGSLLCPNHLGYADVLALGSVVGCFFVSRADAAAWPFLGRLLRSSQQVLVSRRRNRDLTATSRQIQSRLAAGQSVCVFLEGTSSGGDRVLPFLPALLQPAVERQAPIVPVALRWSSSRPEVIVAEDVAYWKDHRFVPHCWRLMGLRGVRAEIVFGAPVTPDRDRKDLAEEVREKVVELWRPEPAGGSPKEQGAKPA